MVVLELEWRMVERLRYGLLINRLLYSLDCLQLARSRPLA